MIDPKLVRHIAALARIELTEEEVARAGADLGKILAYVEQLDRMDLTGIEPLMHAGDYDTPLREDRTAPQLPRAGALRNAPAAGETGFLVPRVIDGP